MTLNVKVKCMKCSLHFEVYSWQDEWKPSFCPECGAKKGFLIWNQEIDDQIFEHVPGPASHNLVSIGG